MDSTNLVVFKELAVFDIVVEPNRIRAIYRVTREDGTSEENTLMYKYEDVFDPNSPEKPRISPQSWSHRSH